MQRNRITSKFRSQEVLYSSYILVYILVHNKLFRWNKYEAYRYNLQEKGSRIQYSKLQYEFILRVNMWRVSSCHWEKIFVLFYKSIYYICQRRHIHLLISEVNFEIHMTYIVIICLSCCHIATFQIMIYLLGMQSVIYLSYIIAHYL